VDVIAVVNQKGGVGKTTTSVNLGAALAHRGYQVLLLDLDPQAHLSISFDALARPEEASVYTVLRGDHRLSEAIRETGVEGLWVVPTNLDLSGAESEFAEADGRHFLLRGALEGLLADGLEADVVLMDCPPSLGLLSLNALTAADRVLIPVQAEFFALQGMAQLLDVVGRVQERLNPDLDLLGILVGMFSRQRNLSREVLHDLHSHFGDLLLRTLVRVNVRLAEAPSHAKTIFEYDAHCPGAKDFAAVAGEVEERLGLAAAPREEAPQASTANGEPEPRAAPEPVPEPAPPRELEEGAAG